MTGRVGRAAVVRGDWVFSPPPGAAFLSRRARAHAGAPARVRGARRQRRLVVAEALRGAVDAVGARARASPEPLERVRPLTYRRQHGEEPQLAGADGLSRPVLFGSVMFTPVQ